ncbi:OpgC [Candidatus Burkholderia humilis]|nr:OpgC [Candidatus Burkholderia humilis]
MTRNARNRFVAWLGIAAMWLAIVAPVISQSVAAKRAIADPIAALCTVDAPTGAQSHASHDEAPADRAGHHDAAGHFEACAYCGLLAHHLPIAQGAATVVSPVERVARAAAAVIVSHVSSKSFNVVANPSTPRLHARLPSFPEAVFVRSPSVDCGSPSVDCGA